MERKVVLITGGSKGIGLAVAELLVHNQYNVVITARNEEEVNQAAQKLNMVRDGVALGMACDVRSYEAQQKVVEAALDTFGRIDVVVANAGVGHFNPVDEMSIEEWNDVIDINLTGVFYTLKSTVAALKKSEGYLITIASLAGTNFFENGSAYNASKFGLVGFTQAAMLDLRKYGIKVSTIMPGSVSTYFNDHTPSKTDHWKIQPEDIALIVKNMLDMNPRTLPSKVEVRPSFPHLKGK